LVLKFLGATTYDKEISAQPCAAARHRFGLGLLIGTFTLMAGMLPFTTTTHAQAYNRVIVGNVTDSIGAAIPNVKVTAISSGTNNKYIGTTSGSVPTRFRSFRSAHMSCMPRQPASKRLL
jgi:hypothetical protein